MPVEQVSSEFRLTESGWNVLCAFVYPQDTVMQPMVLEDHLERREKFDARSSTAMVLVPTGAFGDMAFDRTNEQWEGRWVFRQRATLCRADVFTMVEEHKQRARAERSVIVAAHGASPFGRKM